jgi:hypothetical protein
MKEAISERQLKGIDIRPHNLPYAEIVDMIQGTEGNKQCGVLMLKPGCFSTGGAGKPIQGKTEELFSLNNLDVIATSCVKLTREQVHQLYPNIFSSDVESITGRLDELRILLEDYLSDYVFTYLVQGDSALDKLASIKKVLRENLEHVGNWDVNNLVHVPNEKYLAQDIEILFSRSENSD